MAALGSQLPSPSCSCVREDNASLRLSARAEAVLMPFEFRAPIASAIAPCFRCERTILADPELTSTYLVVAVGSHFSVCWPHNDVCSLVVVPMKSITGKYDLRDKSSCPKLSDFLVFSFLAARWDR